MRNIYIKAISILIGLGVLCGIGIIIFTYVVNFHPADIQIEPVTCKSDAPLVNTNRTIKILSWNVQYMAGKNYIFFYEMPNNPSPDTRPSLSDINITIRSIANVLQSEKPDIILLQEIDRHAKRTYFKNQIHELLSLLPPYYNCHTTAFYWKSAFVPHPFVMGQVGMQLGIISRFRISQAIRYQLSYIPQNWFKQQFNIKRAILQAILPTSQNSHIAILNTHLTAFHEHTNIMQKQVKEVANILDDLERQNISWLIGGDFNLLPPGKQRTLLKKELQSNYRVPTELQLFFDKYSAIPSKHDLNSKNAKDWFTHFPNHPSIRAPDRTIDYIFTGTNTTIRKYHVRQKDTWTLSDHLPVITEVNFK